MAGAVKSFRKAPKPSTSQIPGTQNSPSNFSLLTSSGISALDKLLGGGLPLGSLVLIEEDEFGVHAEILVKYFVSEGAHSGHKVLCASKTDVTQMLSDLPGVIHDPKEEKKPVGVEGEDMTIAWRYNNMKLADSAIEGSGRLGHRLRLNITPNPGLTSNILIWPSPGSETYLMETVGHILQQPEHVVGPGVKQVARIAVLGLGSALWPVDDVARTLYLLRSWLRRSAAVGFVSVPTHLHKDTGLVPSWEHLSDICIRLESFAGTDRATNAALKDYTGFLQVIKLPAFNSIAPHIPPSDLAYKLRRRHFIIERLSLPPELEDTSSASSSLACGGPSGSYSGLDF